jgi:hypothetical protein
VPWLVVVTVVLLTLPSGAAAQDPVRTWWHRGTPTIDGIESVGEWSGAVAGTAPMTLPAGFGGGSFNIDFLLMSDDANVYLAARIPYGFSPTGGELLALVGFGWGATLDRCVPATVVDEWDLFSANDDAIYQDSFAVHLDGCAFQLNTPDVSDGGTAEGTGALVVTGGVDTFFEIAHPFETADDAHDVSAALGDRIAMQLGALGCDAVDCGVPGVLDTRLFLAPAGTVFLGDFEIGDTSDWSTATP